MSCAPPGKYLLRLYINRSTLRSTAAVENVHRVCEQYLKGRYALEIIDIHEDAALARKAQIVAVPTLIKRLPVPFQRLVGDMSNLDHVLSGLQLSPRES